MKPGLIKIVVIDGQGGGIGKALIGKLKNEFPEARLTALGTNAAATGQMLAAGADEGATGENAIVLNSRDADLIMGTLGIVVANSMLGELTPAMAVAIGESRALKILVPVNRCGIHIAGMDGRGEWNLGEYIDLSVKMAKKFYRDKMGMDHRY